MAKTSKYRRIALISGACYGLFYLYTVGDLNFIGPPGWNAYIAEFSFERMFTSRSILMFEAIAVVEAGYLIWLVSPLNLLVAALLSALLAANIHGALFLRFQTQVCTNGRGGLFAGFLPALLAGGACCAPSLILLVGIPALGALSAVVGWLVPLSLVILGLNRLRQNHQGAPSMRITGG